MIKFSKGISIYKFHIYVTNKNSFAECNKEIIKHLERNTDIDKETKQEIIKEVLND